MIERDAIFVLGARDPEMREIARVLRKHGQPFYHAARDGWLVSTRTAYDADGVIKLSRTGRSGAGLLLPRDQAVLVECTVNDREPLLRVDHHNPGDPGMRSRPSGTSPAPPSARRSNCWSWSPPRRSVCSPPRTTASPPRTRASARASIPTSCCSCARRGARRCGTARWGTWWMASSIPLH